MWFGVLFIPEDECEAAGESAVAIVCVYEPHRVWTLAGPPSMAPLLIRGLRDTALETGGVGPPRCESCGEPIDVPPLDDLEAKCASA